MVFSRRDALRWLGGTAGVATLSALACKGRESAPTVPTPPTVARRAGPRKLVLVFLSGGPDAILTMDPKRPTETEPWVDNPLSAENVEDGDISLGALWAPLKPWASKMALVRGVQVESANHFAGTWQFLRLRRKGLRTSPGILDLIARHNPSPLGAVTTGVVYHRVYTPSWLPLDVQVSGPHQGLSSFDKVAPDERAALAEALRVQASRPDLRPADRDSYARVLAYLDALDRVPAFTSADWGPTPQPAAIEGMQRVLWALENDLASSALVYFGFNAFDSHWHNLTMQRELNGAFVSSFGHFLDELARRRNAHGTLAEQTTILVAGELGRYPRLNSDEGKDHLPEISLLAMGAGVETGPRGRVIGQTGRDMLGMPVDLATGKIGGSRYMTLDDIGATVLRMFEIDGTQYGYPAHPIEPLLA